MADQIIDKLTGAPASSEAMLERLDAIIHELQSLRRALLIQATPTTAAPSLTQHLCGVLAPPVQNGAFDVLQEYQGVSEWERFA